MARARDLVREPWETFARTAENTHTAPKRNPAATRMARVLCGCNARTVHCEPQRLTHERRDQTMHVLALVGIIAAAIVLLAAYFSMALTGRLFGHELTKGSNDA